MTDLRPTLLRLLVGEYEGDLDARDLAQMAGVPREVVQREIHSMARAGLLEPRAYRLFQFQQATTTAGLPDTHQRVIRLLVENGPMSRAQLVAAFGSEVAGGDLKRALSDLHEYAQVSPPRCPWVSAKGRELLDDYDEDSIMAECNEQDFYGREP